MGSIKRLLESLLPHRLYRALVAPYHFSLAFFSALKAGFPAKRLKVIAVTGTKGKSSVIEMLARILEESGHTVAVSSTIRFATGNESHANPYKMTLPGRGFIQSFLKDAVEKRCDFAVIEVTSEAAIQYRHLFLSLDALVFTNLQEEHLESHGGMENYFLAKMRIGKALAASAKRPRAIVATRDDEYGKRFLSLPVESSIPFSLEDAQNRRAEGTGMSFTLEGVSFSIAHPGDFSVRNAIASAYAARFFGVPLEASAKALRSLELIRGRAERIEAGQDFLAVVDYAHTPDSLRALYGAYPNTRKICVLGNTGGGRDTWKRPLMGKIAEDACAEVILTNEDPYDEDPGAIVEAMASGMEKKPTIIMDRREAIRTALSWAKAGDAVLITGKGTDPYIMEANGKRTSWDDATVVREELSKLRSGLS